MSFKNIVRAVVYGIVEMSWRLGHVLVRFVTHPQRDVVHWASDGRQSVVIVAPHPDDETLGVGGTMWRHIEKGDSVTLIVVTDGCASKANGLSAAEMRLTRKQEVDELRRMLPVECVFLEYPENHWNDNTLAEALRGPLAGAEIIYAPSCIDFHPEHVRVAKVVATLVRDDQTIRVYEIGVPLTRHLVNIVANIEHVARKKTSQLELYGSQIDAIRPLKRIYKYGKAYYGLGVIEKFWQVSGGAYRRIMAEGNWLDRVRSPYRGIRQNPISDPLSVLIGRQDRLRLKKLSTGL